MIQKNKKFKVLIIEDSMIIRTLVKTILQKDSNFEFYEAKNGKIGYERTLEILPDVILLDIMMPEMNGYEVCELLKKNKFTKEIPIIIISALDEIENKEKGFELGAVDYIIKPVEPQELVARIKTHAELYNAQKELKNYIQLFENDLKTAQTLQYAMLPKKKIYDHIELDWYFKESFNVSGDIFGVLDMTDGSKFIYVIDVSGHGAAAAMLSLLVKQEIENLIYEKKIVNISELGKYLDEKEKNIFNDGSYFTAVFLKIKKDEIKIINFGHRQPFIIRKNKKTEIIRNTNLPLGMGLIENIKNIDEISVEFNKEDMFLIYTDGLVEAHNSKKEEFSEENIINIINNLKEINPNKLVNQIKKELNLFLNNNTPEDDITIVSGIKL